MVAVAQSTILIVQSRRTKVQIASKGFSSHSRSSLRFVKMATLDRAMRRTYSFQFRIYPIPLLRL